MISPQYAALTPTTAPDHDSAHAYNTPTNSPTPQKKKILPFCFDGDFQHKLTP